MCPGDRKAEFHSPVTFLLRAFGYLSLGFSFLILLKVKLCDRTRAAWSQWDHVCVCVLFKLEGGLHMEGAVVVSQPTGSFLLTEGNR